ncbi:hypothetical protein [Actibacterium pelagium]|uniref:hypothetical protein n=1 Tax=Actibacterium pelagium TaxID=2029103 RepID=UPI001304337B|nr:hypothetical protein [Actibacterium pelagium]
MANAKNCSNAPVSPGMVVALVSLIKVALDRLVVAELKRDHFDRRPTCGFGQQLQFRFADFLPQFSGSFGKLCKNHTPVGAAKY